MTEQADTMKAVAAVELVHLAWRHLDNAVSQSIPTDDQIIVGHLKEARTLLRAVIDAQLTSTP